MNTKHWIAFLALLCGALLAAGCYYMPSGAQGSARASLALAKGLPANVSSIALIVSGPGMKTMANEYPVGTSSVSLEVPAGRARTFTLLPSTASVTFKGEATVDLVAGETKEITLSPVLSDTQIIVPDYLNNRLVQISDMLGTGWTVKTGAASALYPYDVDFDSQGRIFVADYSTTPLYYLDDITTNPVSVSIATTYLYALAIDRPANLVYFTNGTLLYRKDLGDPGDPGTQLSIPITGRIMGLAVGPDGSLYLADYGSGFGGFLLKYDPVGQNVLASYPPTVSSYWDPWDVSVQGGYVYSTHVLDLGVKKVARSGLDLNFIDEFTGPGSDPFYGPRRFVAILSRKLTVIDEGYTGVDSNRLAAFSDMAGSGWTTYGATGSSTGQFNFYSYYSC